MDFADQLLEVLDDFLTDELHHSRETMDGNTGIVETADDGSLLITLDDGRSYRLTITSA